MVYSGIPNLIYYTKMILKCHFGAVLLRVESFQRSRLTILTVFTFNVDEWQSQTLSVCTYIYHY